MAGDMEQSHGRAEVIIGKQRHGPTGTVQLQFEAEVTRFSNLARRGPAAGPALSHRRATSRDVPRSAPPQARRRRKPAAFSRSTSARSSRIGGCCRRAPGGAECAAVAKADGYGLGLRAGGAGAPRAGCRSFFVADLSEAVRAREACGDGTVHVLNGLLPGTAAPMPGLG